MSYRRARDVNVNPVDKPLDELSGRVPAVGAVAVRVIHHVAVDKVGAAAESAVELYRFRSLRGQQVGETVHLIGAPHTGRGGKVRVKPAVRVRNDVKIGVCPTRVSGKRLAQGRFVQNVPVGVDREQLRVAVGVASCHPYRAVRGQIPLYGVPRRDNILVDIVKHSLRQKDILPVKDAQAGVAERRPAGHPRRDAVRTTLRTLCQRDRPAVRKLSEISEAIRLEFIGHIARLAGADKLAGLLVGLHYFLGTLYHVALNSQTVFRGEEDSAVCHRKFVLDSEMRSRICPRAVRQEFSDRREVEIPVPDAELRVILHEYVVHIRK